MSKAMYYQTDFKPDYQLFQQKISQLSKQKKKIKKNQISIEKLKHQLELINEEIDDQNLEYDNSNIFLRYASIQQLAQKKKSASDCCVHCGQEMKKSVQCQFCAELYCKNCCWRKRVIPFQQHTDFRLCCEECHQKYIKHFNNQQFYKQKAIYLAAIDQLQRKFDKTRVKYDKKENEVKEYKQQKRGIKIKQGNLKKALLQQQKAIKILTQEYEKAIQNKAIQLKQEQNRQKNQNKQLYQERQRFEEQQKLQQQKRLKQLQVQQQRFLQNSRKRQQELAKRQANIKRQKQLLERQKEELTSSRLKQIQESKKVEIIKQKPNIVSEQIKETATLKSSEVQDKKSQKSTKDKEKEKSEQSINLSLKDETPRKVVFNQELNFDAILKDQVKQKQQQQKTQQKKQTQTEEKNNEVTLKQFLKEMKESKRIQETKIENQKEGDNKQEKQNTSQISKKSQSKEVNESPRLTMNQIKTMSMNDLLSMKIPMNPNAQSQQKRVRKSSHPEIKVQAEQNSTTTQNQKMYQSLIEPDIPQSSLVGLAFPTQNYRESIEKQEIFRQTIQSVHEQEEDENQKQNSKKALLMRQSLLSSSNKVSISGQKRPQYNDQQTTIGQPQKCTCEIM